MLQGSDALHCNMVLANIWRSGDQRDNSLFDRLISQWLFNSFHAKHHLQQKIETPKFLLWLECSLSLLPLVSVRGLPQKEFFANLSEVMTT